MVIGQRRLLTLHRRHAQRLLAAQEEERARVAREVHDEAVQRLVALQHELTHFRAGASVPASGERHLAGIQGDVEDLAVFLRRMAHRLHPAVIDQSGLVAALTQLAQEMSRGSGLSVQLDLPTERPALSSERAVVLFRIAQEALRNVVRHAGVGEATVRLRTVGGMVELAVEDRGRGFDPGARRRDAGLGLISMTERAELVGGHASVRAQPGRGTSVIARVPNGGGPA